MARDTTKTIKRLEAYQFIKANILNGTYGPGYRIIIDQVAKELKLSIIPVREAIQQLEADGLIEVIPYRGAIVLQVGESEYLEAAFVMLVLEAAATALASEKLTQQNINNLEDINRAMKEALNNLDYEQMGELNVKFHATIHDKCGNAYLIDKLRQVWQRISQFRHASVTFALQRASASVDEHEQLLQLLREKAPAAVIEDYVRQHTLNTLKAVQNQTRKARNYLINSI